MADTKQGPVIASNKLAMSRALGAAFLNHQVEQLEKTVSGPGTGNWRDRRAPDAWNKTDPKRTRSPRVSRRDGEDAEVEAATERPKRKEESKPQKDADVVVVDASVLVHAIPHIKKWCREGREEIVIVPLEALNTLDLLKKGTSTLAQRARAASRILEAQVGTNPRIRVQHDDAFVPWDRIFAEQGLGSGAPEWVRRTICCARWEVDRADDATADKKSSDDKDVAGAAGAQKPHVLLAILSQSPEAQAEALAPPSAPVSASPVPLPAPQANRHEPRASGSLVAQWAAKARLPVLEIAPMSIPNANDAPVGGRRSGEIRRPAEEERGKRGGAPGHGHRGRRNSRGGGASGRPGSSGGTGLVERPPAVMAMMEMVAQPSRVVRVLARGEKLEPDS
ncbi:hypothetical protein OBBRIDRAFT_661759 [Obba rivulosa]|uniref:PIN domain-containing protein n=1 Tax=Obba rivulosa TaxID=1052685 RepID=A0A8E2ARB1_9APHY|nr:hypothetical protein OBBRIDRAFT_661759 [Obba rivulosa]